MTAKPAERSQAQVVPMPLVPEIASPAKEKGRWRMYPAAFFGGEMGKKKYFKPEPPHVRGICVRCHERPQKVKKRGKFRPLCSRCDRLLHPCKRSKPRVRFDFPYTRHKKNSCEQCGFVALHKCQLDVDHIDGDHSNSDPSNLQTLCANCHRLKTHVQRWQASTVQPTENSDGAD